MSASGVFAIITCEVEYESEADSQLLPQDQDTLKRRIAATVEGALDGHAELTVYGRVKVELS